jgi:NADPH:quinone reductase-like Zn-dependent oxidoreductase
MRAAVYDQYGGPEVLHETLIDMPTPKEGEVLVRVYAASVNGFDIGARSGALKMFTGKKFPQRMGLDFAGEIVTATKTSVFFKQGDKVWGAMPLHHLGSAAEFICVKPMHLAHSPKNLEPSDLAAGRCRGGR